MIEKAALIPQAVALELLLDPSEIELEERGADTARSRRAGRQQGRRLDRKALAVIDAA